MSELLNKNALYFCNVVHPDWSTVAAENLEQNISIDEHGQTDEPAKSPVKMVPSQSNEKPAEEESSVSKKRDRESEEDGTVDISSLPDLLRKVFKIAFALERHHSKFSLALHDI